MAEEKTLPAQQIELQGKIFHKCKDIGLLKYKVKRDTLEIEEKLLELEKLDQEFIALDKRIKADLLAKKEEPAPINPEIELT